MSERYQSIKCARCGNGLMLERDGDGIVVVHPCARCTPHPALMASAEDFAELRRDVDVLMERVTALEVTRAQTMTEAPELRSGLYGVRSTPQQVTQTGGTGEEGV